MRGSVQDRNTSNRVPGNSCDPTHKGLGPLSPIRIHCIHRVGGAVDVGVFGEQGVAGGEAARTRE